MESDGHANRPAGCASCATRLCGALCGGGRPPRGGRRRSFVGGDRLLVPVNLYGADSSRARARRSRATRCAAERPAIRMMALAARRELGGGVRQHPGSNNCVEVAYGIARFAEREAVESDGHTRSTCGVRELRDSPVRRSVRQRAAAGDRLLVAIGRCWRRRGSAPRRAGAGDDGPPRGSVRPTRHSPPRGSVSGQHDTRRHTATSMLLMLLLRPPAAPRGSAMGCSPKHGAERSGSLGPGKPLWRRFFARPREAEPSDALRSRATRDQDDGAGGAARARRWCATAPRFKQLR